MYLTSLGITDETEYAADINPHKTGKFMAGTGQEIVAPGVLVASFTADAISGTQGASFDDLVVTPP